MHIIITDQSALRIKSEKANKEEAEEIIIELEKTLALAPGVGLAAPQIGINKSVAIIRIKTGGYEQNVNLVNPEILDKEQGFINKQEGCLSIPDKRFNTWRSKEIFVKDDTNPAGFIATGFEAIAIQHEIDHLNGVLISDIAIKDKIGRNDPCPCGKIKNGIRVKFKKCHGR